jgi:hypothetical protein
LASFLGSLGNYINSNLREELNFTFVKVERMEGESAWA